MLAQRHLTPPRSTWSQNCACDNSRRYSAYAQGCSLLCQHVTVVFQNGVPVLEAASKNEHPKNLVRIKPSSSLLPCFIKRWKSLLAWACLSVRIEMLGDYGKGGEGVCCCWGGGGGGGVKTEQCWLVSVGAQKGIEAVHGRGKGRKTRQERPKMRCERKEAETHSWQLLVVVWVGACWSSP